MMVDKRLVATEDMRERLDTRESNDMVMRYVLMNKRVKRGKE